MFGHSQNFCRKYIQLPIEVKEFILLYRSRYGDIRRNDRQSVPFITHAPRALLQSKPCFHGNDSKC